MLLRRFSFHQQIKTCLLFLRYLTVFQWHFELTAYDSRHTPDNFFKCLKLKLNTSFKKKQALKPKFFFVTLSKVAFLLFQKYLFSSLKSRKHKNKGKIKSIFCSQYKMKDIAVHLLYTMFKQGFPSQTHALAESFLVSYSFLCSVKPYCHISQAVTNPAAKTNKSGSGGTHCLPLLSVLLRNKLELLEITLYFVRKIEGLFIIHKNIAENSLYQEIKGMHIAF